MKTVKITRKHTHTLPGKKEAATTTVRASERTTKRRPNQSTKCLQMSHVNSIEWNNWKLLVLLLLWQISLSSVEKLHALVNCCYFLSPLFIWITTRTTTTSTTTTTVETKKYMNIFANFDESVDQLAVYLCVRVYVCACDVSISLFLLPSVCATIIFLFVQSICTCVQRTFRLQSIR